MIIESLEELRIDDFEQVWEIMEISFPIDERRNYEAQKKILDNAYYHLYGYKMENKVVAFFAVWKFEQMSFIEHFAVNPQYRNGGLGAELLQELLKNLVTPVVLEVEFPESEIPQRRIRFYERNGLSLNPYMDYIQPALSEEGHDIPLMIMTYPREVSREEYEQMRDILYHEVYHVC